MGIDFSYLVEKRVNGKWENVDTSFTHLSLIQSLSWDERIETMVWMEDSIRYSFLPKFHNTNIINLLPVRLTESRNGWELSKTNEENYFEISCEARKKIETMYLGSYPIIFISLTDIRKTDWMEIDDFWDNYGITNTRKEFISFNFVGYLYFINYCFKNMEIICHEELNDEPNDIRLIYWAH